MSCNARFYRGTFKLEIAMIGRGLNLNRAIFNLGLINFKPFYRFAKEEKAYQENQNKGNKDPGIEKEKT